MKIAIVGTGYVGLVSGTCFAEIGVNVVCVDTDEKKIENLKKGIIPIYEPGLEDMVLRNTKAGRLNFTTSLKECLDDVDVVFSAVGTPPDEDGSADLKYVLQVARTIGANMNKYLLVVTKSTVPVGTAKKVKDAIQEELDKRGVKIEFDVASNPEFLKEGNAVDDFMSPDRVVVGVESERAQKLMTKLYKPFLLNNFRVIFMDVPSAEMTKYAANAMLATRISFMNDIANLCERVGADVECVRKGIGSDTRIGKHFLYAGCGYGGSCFPKDVKALIHTGIDNGYHMEVIEAVERVNEYQKSVVYDKLICLMGDVKGKTIGVLGLAFKPETDDIGRRSPDRYLRYVRRCARTRLHCQGSRFDSHHRRRRRTDGNIRDKYPQPGLHGCDSHHGIFVHGPCAYHTTAADASYHPEKRSPDTYETGPYRYAEGKNHVPYHSVRDMFFRCSGCNTSVRYAFPG